MYFNFQKKDHSEGTEGDAKYLAPELMSGHFGKPADIFRWEAKQLCVWLDIHFVVLFDRHVWSIVGYFRWLEDGECKYSQKTELWSVQKMDRTFQSDAFNQMR